MSEVKRYSFWPQIVHLPGGGGVRAEVHFKVEEDGLFVAHQDYASLKAEVERLRASSFVTAVPVEQYEKLKAEVERLRQEVENADRESMSDEYDLNNQIRIINGLLTDKEQMQGKIDRLTKAGDLLAFHYISLGRKFFPEDPLPSSITNWNAAKEGKQP